MRFVIVIGAALTSLLSASAAIAQSSLSNKELRQIAYKYGACVVKHRAVGASKAVLNHADNFTLKTRYIRLIDSGCFALHGALAFPGDFYIYTLADALVARELKDAPVPDLSKVRPEERSTPDFSMLKRKFGYDIAVRRTGEAETVRPMNEFGECVVRQSPASAKELLMTEPETTAESARFEELQPAFSICAQDKTMELSKILLRGTIAFNYYRLAQAALQVPVH